MTLQRASCRSRLLSTPSAEQMDAPGASHTQSLSLSLMSAARLEGVQSNFERLDEVVGVLNPARHAHETVRDPHLLSVLLEHVGVRHHLHALRNMHEMCVCVCGRAFVCVRACVYKHACTHTLSCMHLLLCVHILGRIMTEGQVMIDSTAPRFSHRLHGRCTCVLCG